MVIHQQLSREQLPDIIKLSALVNGLKGSVKNFVLLNLDGDSSLSDLDNLLAIYASMQNQHESSFHSSSDRACIDKLEEERRQESIEGRGRDEAYPPKTHKQSDKRKPDQFPKGRQWCHICWKKGHRTQACWWNSNQQQPQHLQQQAWCQLSRQQPWTAQASMRSLQHVDKNTSPMGSLERKTLAASFAQETRATTQTAYTIPTSTIAQLDSPDHASSTAEAWGILVDTGAATSVAPKGFASDIELSPAPSMLQLTTATGQAIETYGLRKVHLESRGLSLEVSSVIADVVTPLLGLDIMLQNTLSLQVDHDLQQALVNPAGDRTQL